MLNILLWCAQVAIFGLYVMAGVMKVTMPVARISKIWPWTGQVSERFLRAIGVVDLAGGIGVLIPAVTHVLPQLTAFAIAGCDVLQVCAIVFHIRRGEGAATPFNVVVLAVCAFAFTGTLHGWH